MLDDALRSQLREHFTKITQPVELLSSLDDGPKSTELAELLDGLAELSDHITVRRTDDDPRRPSFSIHRVGTDVSVRFAGIPGGHEFTSLVLAVLQVGGHPGSITDEVAEAVRNLEGEYDFETYMSLSCQNCPDVVQALNLMSVINPRIRHTAIDGALFADEVEDRGVKSVPMVFCNGEFFESGRMDLEQILGRLDSGAEARAAAALAEEAPFDVLVVGGGPAGASAAIYAARKGIRTGIVTERFGGQVLDTMGIENFISVPYTEGPKLVTALEQHVLSYDVTLINRQQATRLVPAEDPSGLHTIELASGASLQARTVVLSTGARWRTLGVPGEEDYRNKGVTFCPHCDGPLFKGKRVAVVGGGNSGIEAAIDLGGLVGHVTVIEFDDQLRADEVLQRKLRSMGNTEVVLGAATSEVVGNGDEVTGLRYVDRATSESHQVDLDGVFVQIGLLPNTEWLSGVVECSPRGEVVVDERGQTSIPGVFAAGDCTIVPFKQIVISLGAGATAALSAFDHLIRTPVPV